MLSKIDQRALDSIRTYYADHDIMPTYREIQDRMGYASINSAWKLVQRLIEAGYIKKLGHRIAPDNLFL